MDFLRFIGLAALLFALAACGHLHGFGIGGGQPAAPSGGPSAASVAQAVSPPPPQPLAAHVEESPLSGVRGGGAIRIAPGFLPSVLAVEGETRGRRAARSVGRSSDGSRCTGRIASQPDWIVDLEQPFSYLRVDATHEGDAKLVLEGPDGAVRCDDDSGGGTAARVDGAFAAGRWQIYVASNRRRTERYALTVTEFRPEERAVRVDATDDGTAAFGRLWIGGEFDGDQVLHGTTGGGVDARIFGQSMSGACEGWVDGRPGHLVHVGAAFPYLRFDARSAADTTLVVRGPTGVWCDDDSGGRNDARVVGPFQPGLYEVWVGSYDAGERQPYQLTVSRQQIVPAPAAPARTAVAVAPSPPPPPPAPAPAVYAPAATVRAPAAAPHFGTVTLTPGFVPDPYAVRGASGGRFDARQLGFPQSCTGWVSDRPDHVLVLPADTPYLRIDAAGSGDTTLVVSGPRGTYCDDDGGGNLAPRVAGYFPAGTYDIRVGSYRNGESIPYVLSFSELAAPAPTVSQVAVAPAAPPAPVGPRAVDDARFRELLAHYRDTPMMRDQPAVARQIVDAGNWFTCAQIAELVRATALMHAEVEVAVTLFSHAVDRDNVHRITGAFSMMHSAGEFRSRAGI